MSRKVVYLMAFLLLIPYVYSNGGCIKVADDVLVQLSSAPSVPFAGQQASFLVSFGNLEKNIITQEINGKLRIVKNEDIILEKDFKIKGGILDLKHTFKNPGVYELFLEFKVEGKSYKPEDFLIEVKEQGNNRIFNFLFLIAGIIIGIVLTKFITKKGKK